MFMTINDLDILKVLIIKTRVVMIIVILNWLI